MVELYSMVFATAGEMGNKKHH